MYADSLKLLVLLCSLRALYGTDGTQNATHGSDSPASAAREIRFFFPQLSQVCSNVIPGVRINMCLSHPFIMHYQP